MLLCLLWRLQSINSRRTLRCDSFLPAAATAAAAGEGAFPHHPVTMQYQTPPRTWISPRRRVLRRTESALITYGHTPLLKKSRRKHTSENLATKETGRQGRTKRTTDDGRRHNDGVPLSAETGGKRAFEVAMRASRDTTKGNAVRKA